MIYNLFYSIDFNIIINIFKLKSFILAHVLVFCIHKSFFNNNNNKNIIILQALFIRTGQIANCHLYDFAKQEIIKHFKFCPIYNWVFCESLNYQDSPLTNILYCFYLKFLASIKMFIFYVLNNLFLFYSLTNRPLLRYLEKNKKLVTYHIFSKGR